MNPTPARKAPGLLEQRTKKDPHLAMRVFNQNLAPEVGLEPTTP